MLPSSFRTFLRNMRNSNYLSLKMKYDRGLCTSWPGTGSCGGPLLLPCVPVGTTGSEWANEWLIVRACAKSFSTPLFSDISVAVAVVAFHREITKKPKKAHKALLLGQRSILTSGCLVIWPPSNKYYSFWRVFQVLSTRLGSFSTSFDP